MKKSTWFGVLVALLACGLIAVGCGGGGDSTTDTGISPTSTTGNSPDDVYNACIDAIEGSPAESLGKTACEQAKNAFQTCSDKANDLSNDNAKSAALNACQQAADSAISALKSAS